MNRRGFLRLMVGATAGAVLVEAPVLAVLESGRPLPSMLDLVFENSTGLRVVRVVVDFAVAGDPTIFTTWFDVSKVEIDGSTANLGYYEFHCAKAPMRVSSIRVEVNDLPVFTYLDNGPLEMYAGDVLKINPTIEML